MKLPSDEPKRGTTLHKVDVAVTNWMADNGILLLRLSIGIIFLWYGLLKFFTGISPAESLAINTIDALTFGLLSPKVIIISLATLETLIGIGLLFNLFLRETLLLLYLQMIGTFTPIFLFPGEVFFEFPYALTLEGQYIFKNLVVVSAGIVIGATVRGGKLVAQAKKDAETEQSDQTE
jgi:uncharacterized membrane protein YphA (DoxX/SURF4 family)